MKISTLMWPMTSWPEAVEQWRRAEELGFDTAWVFDHTAWMGITPWYDAYATMAAAAAVTSRIRLGTLVTSPNFRHPVPTAHAAKTIDHISGGRLTLGIGSGGPTRTSDGGILGGPEWTPRERADRFAEWVVLLDRLLSGTEVTYEGTYYSAREVRTQPGCVQRPRVPFMLAGNGPRGMRLTARYGEGWVSTGGRVKGQDPWDTVRAQVGALRAACEEEGRDPGSLHQVLLAGFAGEPWLESPQAFADLSGRYGELGFGEIVVAWPRPRTKWDGDLNVDTDLKVFESIAPAG
jgi:alkanesulfonate monooxygenase SsuD/methylene tetrahydromethanopterin reductase-like flavin-dependent oxidoreductase (luciferase family)